MKIIRIIYGPVIGLLVAQASSAQVTAAGSGNTAATWATQATAGNVSTSITTSAADSLVFAMVSNSGRNNGSGTPNH